MRMNRWGAACLAALALVEGGAARAEQINASQLRQNLFAVCFADGKEGWAVGDLGRIFHTVDAGKNWEIQSSDTKLQYASVACPTKTDLWVTGQGGQIARSADGGRTWKAQQSGVTRQLLTIAFANTQRGVAVGDFGVIVQTEDGGNTWTKVPLPADMKLPEDVAEVVDAGDVVLYGATFGSPDVVRAAGEFGIILGSDDGGKTWHQQPNAVESTLFSINFADAQRGWAVGMDATLLSTTNGGTTWEKQTIETPKGFMLPLYDVQRLPGWLPWSGRRHGP
ncbi:MAG: hypothetical protein HY270_09515 [Deltaproteobacteria bacterium]|nr:hypothetical protein [Deltaproteobacteria bacterium]